MQNIKVIKTLSCNTSFAAGLSADVNNVCNSSISLTKLISQIKEASVNPKCQLLNFIEIGPDI